MVRSFALLPCAGAMRRGQTLVLAATIGWVTLGAPAVAVIANPANPASSTSPLTGEDGYLLGAGDRIRIDFFNVPELSGEFQVLPNGTINLPQIGAVSVLGRTLRQAEAAISSRAAALLRRPIVTVSLLAARPLSIAIAGEVTRPGTYNLPAISPANATVPTLTSIIQLAEGITQAADLRRVQVRRRSSYNAAADQLFTVDLWQLLQAADLRQDLQLRDGDSIFIPTAERVDLAEARQLVAANIATRTNRPLKIAVVGEVNRPGPYTLLEGRDVRTEQRNDTPSSQTPSVTQAIQTAGGITQSADIRNIHVRRLKRTGGEQLVKVDFWKLLQEGDLQQDLPIQDGDTIVIPTASRPNDREITALAGASFSPDKITVNVVGEVERPGAVAVPPNTPLTQGLLAAGGFNRRASKRAVTLIRLNPNGSVTKRDIEVDLARGVDANANPALRNNDIIVVKKSAIAGIGDTLGTFLSPVTGIFSLFRILGL